MSSASHRPISIATFGLFYFGHGDSIRRVLAARGALCVAILLTLSAGLAREYDAEYLVAEPWYAVIPLGIALVMGTVLHSLLLATSYRFISDVPKWRSWAAFVTGYLMLAPAAWLYAIPFERWYSELVATGWNLRMLAAVSCIRVLLITKIAAVHFRRSYLAMLLPVMLFSSTATIFGLLSSFRLVNVMGGVRLNDVEILVQKTEAAWFAMAFYSWPIWLVGTCIVGARRPRALPSPAPGQVARVGVSTYVLALASVAVWLLFLPGPQREQRMRHEVENRFASRDIEGGLRILAEHPQSQFPPLWKPPPLGFERVNVDFADVFERLPDSGVPPWVRKAYLAKLKAACEGTRVEFMFDDTDWRRIAEALVRMPESRQFAGEVSDELQRAIGYSRNSAFRSAAQLILAAAQPVITSNPSTDTASAPSP